ncbi:MAG: DUF2442 domain-containing protein [Alphaproteobacteria bacterium]|nr:DUF2442 domain-containing protein [Alphaproteobacteria bacterium]
MTSSAAELIVPSVTSVAISDDVLTMVLSDGRSVSVPLAWYPRLLHASTTERHNHRLIGKGQGVHWPDVDEDISVESVLRGQPSAEDPSSLSRWLDARK